MKTFKNFSIITVCILAAFSIQTDSAGMTKSKITVTGVVLDGNEKPVSGAFILIDNKTTNIKTDERGFYKIKVSPKARLITAFTLLNGVSEVEINGRTVINFNLKISASPGKPEITNFAGDETVNVGYGTVKKKDQITSIGKIDATNKKYASYSNIFQLLAGFPGVRVSGKNSITVQGSNSFQMNTNPLFVVDDIIVKSIDYISPSMVRSITVLKGAAASIYGAEASNGVILIYLLR
jgi:TonB-dependent SusC/RagA subfamily outer membrane receptor